ncbi:complex I intermediate-associated protein 30 [Augochlora pura]
MSRVLHLCSKISNAGTRTFHNGRCMLGFWEPERSNYPVVYDDVEKRKNLSLLERFKARCRDFKVESTLLLKEMRNIFNIYPNMIIPDVEDVIWKFDGTLDSRKQWVLTCDSDYNEGFSTAKLDFTRTGTGLFHGYLSPRVPKDGSIGRAGYCNITTIRKTKSFQRKATYDFSGYNSFVLRVRGDGRCYMLNVLQKGEFDITWNHAFHYFLQTTGGPYWQHVKVPFAKFLFATKGVIQNDQEPMPTSTITNFGITLGDKIEGPFQLEIDYIGVCYDPAVFESCAYETVDIRDL